MSAPDIIDRAAGLGMQDPRFATRRLRPEFVEGAEICRASVLEPQSDLGLSKALRAALARRMAAMNGDEALVAHYDALMRDAGADISLKALAEGATGLAEPFGAIARHTDLVTGAPALAAGEDIARLADAGLTNPQIVALSELIAFVNFQVRVVAGLRLMGDA